MQAKAQRKNSRCFPWWAQGGAFGLIFLLHVACATHVPVGKRTARANQAWGLPEKNERAVWHAPPGFEPRIVVRADLIEAHNNTRVVTVTKVEFQRAVQRLAGAIRLKGTPQEAAQQTLHALPEEELLAEVYRGRVLSLLPLRDQGALVPETESALKENYLKWCQKRGGGDCLGLLTDGPYLGTDDRRTLALALAFGTVLDETSAALGHQLNTQAIVSSLIWTAGIYFSLWLVPEPSTKAVAASLSVALLAWLGVDAVWGLLDGWATMAHRAHDATTFEELSDAGEAFGRRIGVDAARAIILAVAALSGRTLSEVATSMRSLPKFNLVQAQWTVQGFRSPVTVAVQEVAAVELAPGIGRAFAVVTSPQAPMALAMLSQSNAARTAGDSGRSGTIDIQHHGGNRQVVLMNGQRWHLPRGKDLHDIPAEDRIGDELQAAAERIAHQWTVAGLSSKERAAIKRARDAGNEVSARHLEGLARGRWVNARLKEDFPQLQWSPRGVDAVDPRPGGLKYEILSGTKENFAVHGRRMATEFFRMIFF